MIDLNKALIEVYNKFQEFDSQQLKGRFHTQGIDYDTENDINTVLLKALVHNSIPIVEKDDIVVFRSWKQEPREMLVKNYLYKGKLILITQLTTPGHEWEIRSIK